MAQADTLGIYPLSTPGGDAIPLDIIRPLKLYRQDFNDEAGTEVAFAADVEIVVCWATRACIVCFGAVVAMPASGSSVNATIILPANTLTVIDLNGLDSFSSMGIAEEGTVFVQQVQKWQDIRKNTQYNRN